ncbi:DUF1684 domain-containing protein [Aquirufa sp.]|jgi:uncharacterized protein (DUF1684 family)|uniref:DUF1684 domain-containing protein n=1 Tax=Aquirufa sp. TaxID=2676249 RepID=UPI0037BF99D2
MKFNRWFLILFVIVATLIYFSLPKQTKIPAKTTEDSLKTVESRLTKDEKLKTDEESPITDRANFKGLSYFPYSPNWVIPFEVERNEKVERVGLQMTDGTSDTLLVFGKAHGEIAGVHVDLILYQHDTGDFFIPFKDKTAPTETYGGGRYLELPLTNLKDNQLILDFNQAYFPFCAYNKSFACPIPPKENQLTIRIPAGEKNP